MSFLIENTSQYGKKYLAYRAPGTPSNVGYSFTDNVEEAWQFDTDAKASRKADVLMKHIYKGAELPAVNPYKVVSEPEPDRPKMGRPPLEIPTFRIQPRVQPATIATLAQLQKEKGMSQGQVLDWLCELVKRNRHLFPDTAV